MATNPYAWAANYAANAQTAAENSRARAQQVLLSLFREQALRERPLATLPATLAIREAEHRADLPYQTALINARTEANRKQRRYYNQMQLELKQELADKGLAPKYNGATMVTAGGVPINGINNGVVTVGGKSYTLTVPPPIVDDTDTTGE